MIEFIRAHVALRKMQRAGFDIDVIVARWYVAAHTLGA